MRGRLWAEITARVVLTCAALLPYRQLLTFNTIYVTDDFFASDIFNGELPGRVLIGEAIRRGEIPVWTSKLCSGIPLAGVVVNNWRGKTRAEQTNPLVLSRILNRRVLVVPHQPKFVSDFDALARYLVKKRLFHWPYLP